MGGGLFGLGAGTPSRFPYKGRPQPSPGVAPSPGIVVRANKVIVFGPTGTVVGVFVYAAGTTPALGNVPVAWISESTTDPFGNTLPAPATDIATFNSATHELAWMSRGAVHVGLTTDFNPGSVTGVSGGLSIASPLATGADVPGSVHLDSALSPRGNGATPQLKLFNGTVINANGAAVPVTGGLAVTGGATTDTLTATGKVTATGGTAASPTVISSDTWQPLTLLNTWTGTLSLRRLADSNLMQVFGLIQPGAASPVTTVCNIGALYQPKNSVGTVVTVNSPVFDSTASVVHNSAVDTTFRIAGTYAAGTDNVVVNIIIPLAGP